MQTQVVGFPPSSDAYMRHGWKLIPIPPNSKGPTHTGWNTVAGCMNNSQLPSASWNVGLAHAYSKTCAIDIDNWDMAVTYLTDKGIDLSELFNMLDAVQIDSGNAGHGKLLYKLDIPLPSKKIVIDGVTVLELRCATKDGLTVQDVLPPSRHPSGTTYRWAGRGDWDKLPQLPDSLLQLWQELLTVKPAMAHNTTAEWSEIQSALASISPDCDHDTWLNIGMALSSTKHENAYALWVDWSSKSDKYNAAEMPSRWKSFHNTVITIGSLFHHAYAAGWQRPLPEGMFSAVTAKPAQVLKRLEHNIDPPTVNLNLWPTVLAERANEIANEVGCDPVVPLMAALAAVSAAADKRIKLKITDSWSVPPILWLMTVGAPSDKKSPGSRPMFKTLKQLEAEDIDRYNALMLVWKGKEAKTASQLKTYREWAASPESDLPNSLPPTYTECPPEPKQLRLLVNDSTSQKIVHMAVGRERGFLLYLDEMNHWLTKLNSSQSTEDRGCWIQGYESGSYQMDRVGAGSIKADNLAVSIYGNCQPAVFKQHMNAASNDGLVQRFIPVVLNGECTTEWQDSLPEFMSSGPAYDAMLRQVFAVSEGSILCSSEAISEFRRFGQWYHEGRKADILLNSSEVYMTAVGKIEGTCARLALLLHLVNSPHSQQLTVETMASAVKIMKQFIVPSLRYCFMELVGLKDSLQSWIVDYVIQLASVRTTVSLGDIKKGSRRQVGTRKGYEVENDIRLAMEELEGFGYVKIEQDVGRSVSWFINPQLAELYKEHRAAVIAAKHYVIESFKYEAIAKYGFTTRKDDAIGYEVR